MLTIAVGAEAQTFTTESICPIDSAYAAQYGQPPVSLTSGGNPGAQIFFPSEGTINALIVYVQHKDDFYEHCYNTTTGQDLSTSDSLSTVANPCNAGPDSPTLTSWTDDVTTEWPALHSRGSNRQLPLMAVDQLAPPGTTPSQFAEGSISEYYHLMSGGLLTITGYVYPEVYIPEHPIGWYHPNRGSFENGAVALSHEVITYVDNNRQGIVFDARFDNYRNGFGYEGTGGAFADGKFDMVILAYRFNNIQILGASSIPTAGALASLGATSFDVGHDAFEAAGQPLFLGSLQVVDNYSGGSGVLAGGGARLIAHEIGHRQFGFYHTRGLDALSVMEEGETVASMSAGDLVKLRWVSVDTLDATTFRHDDWTLGDATQTHHLLYIDDATPGHGGILVEGRDQANFWDRPPDGVNADGDLGDFYLPQRGLYVYRSNTDGSSFTEMQNNGALTRSALTYRGPAHTVAFGPGDAYSPFSKMSFVFYTNNLLDDGVAITDIVENGSTFEFDLWTDFLREDSHGVKTLSSNYTMNASSSLGRNAAWTLGGMFRLKGGFDPIGGNSFLMDPQARLEVASQGNVLGSSSQPITFGRSNGSLAWDGIVIQGEATQFSYARVEGATVGVEVAARAVVMEHVTITGNATGIETDFETCFPGEPCADARGQLSLATACITDNTVTGLGLRNADVYLESVVASGSGDVGVYLQNADAYGANYVLVTDNGAVPLVAGPGISLLSGGDLTLHSVFHPHDGNNRIDANAGDEIVVASGAYLSVGLKGGPGENRITDSVGGVLIRNLSNAEIAAKHTFWHASGSVPSGAFVGSVDASDPLSSDPSGPFPSCTGTIPLAESGPSSVAALTGDTGASSVGSEGQQVLRTLIIEAREAVERARDRGFTSEAAALIGRLAGLQRLDRYDVLLERTATFEVLGYLRRLLEGEPDADARGAAEAALVAEIDAALRETDTDAAAALLSTYSSRVTGQRTLRLLALHQATLDDRAGRVSAALATWNLEAEALESEGERALAASLRLAIAAASAQATTTGALTTESSSVTLTTPLALGLSPARPNPFSRSTEVTLTLPETSRVEAIVFDALGRQVATLASGSLDRGRHVLSLDGSSMAPGVYIIRTVVSAGIEAERILTQRVALLR